MEKIDLKGVDDYSITCDYYKEGCLDLDIWNENDDAIGGIRLRKEQAFILGEWLIKASE